MIDATTLVTYSLIVLGFVFIPGPATLLTIAGATTSGSKVGIATGAGIAAGDIVHTLLAVFGLSAIIAASALLFSIIKYLGAAYLIYLGIKAITSKSASSFEGDVMTVSTSAAFRQALYSELLNPKTALFFLAFLPQFVQPENGFVLIQLTILGLVFVALGLLSTLVYAFGAGTLGGLVRRNPAILKWQGKVVGTIFCTLGVRLALQER
ncbi:LysE family translocator [Roseibium sp.]|uniref:LysE family translocator n=1 Tax=Roseibium sp. TaxID=1936156 RepID=UPI003B5166F3